MTGENKSFNLDGKIAIVTGSAQGIGKSIATVLAKNGAIVVVSDIQADKGEATARELRDPAIFVPCDISDVAQVRSLVDNVIQRFGRLDIMVNNAGINSTRHEDRVTIDEYPDETWNRIIDVDLNGTFYCCKTAATAMRKQRSGNIINIASAAGVVALRLQIAYVAAKAAILKMTEAMACELGPYGIRVNAVSPGSTLTEITRNLFYSKEGTFSALADRVVSFIPQGRPGTTEEIANAVAFLISDQASYLNGHNLVVDGGWTSGFNRDF
ncbi:MAG: SDR family oxidoreductase [Deltaproteobacteria bacterium]|nr:SDR family oxidoreductase [Deltaproteobacteria bacterium]